MNVPLNWNSHGSWYAPDILNVVRNGGIESQKRSPSGLSRAVDAAVVEPSQSVDARRSVLMPPNSSSFSRRRLALSSKPL